MTCGIVTEPSSARISYILKSMVLSIYTYELRGFTYMTYIYYCNPFDAYPPLVTFCHLAQMAVN
jgi:hypothetical protein